MRRRRVAPAFGGAADSSAAVAWGGRLKIVPLLGRVRRAPPSGSAAAARLPPGRCRACPRRCAGAALAGCLCPGSQIGAACGRPHFGASARTRRAVAWRLGGRRLRVAAPCACGLGALKVLRRPLRRPPCFRARRRWPLGETLAADKEAPPFLPAARCGGLPCRRGRARPRRRGPAPGPPKAVARLGCLRAPAPARVKPGSFLSPLPSPPRSAPRLACLLAAPRQVPPLKAAVARVRFVGRPGAPWPARLARARAGHQGPPPHMRPRN